MGKIRLNVIRVTRYVQDTIPWFWLLLPITPDFKLKTCFLELLRIWSVIPKLTTNIIQSLQIEAHRVAWCATQETQSINRWVIDLRTSLKCIYSDFPHYLNSSRESLHLIEICGGSNKRWNNRPINSWLAGYLVVAKMTWFFTFNYSQV